MKRFTVIETLRSNLKRLRSTRVIAIFGLIVILTCVAGFTNMMGGGRSSNVSAPVVNAEMLDDETTVTTSVTTLETTTETISTTVPDTTVVETTTFVDTTTSFDTTTIVSSTTKTRQTTKKVTTVTTTTTIQTTTSTTEVHIVYKPKTHYFHLTSCKWYDPKTCVEEWDINEIEGRICSKCKPDIELVNVYTPPVEETSSSSTGPYTMSNLPVTQAEFYMLANLVAHEYGANWVSEYEKAKVVMTVMNRVNSSRFPNTIRSVILQRNQYCWVPDSYYWARTTQSCKDAVLYYFNHRSEYSTSLYSFYGDGRVNHFY